MSVNELSYGLTLEDLLGLWRSGTERDVFHAAELRLREKGGEPANLAVVRRATADRQDVSALEALRANERIVTLLTGWRWLAIRQAREEGHSWTDIGAALNMSKQGAWDLYQRAIKQQETYAGEFFSPAERQRAIAVLTDTD